MYMIRPALRASTGKAPARIVRGRRYPSTTRLRSFHSTQYVSRAADPPPSPDKTPIDSNDPDKKDRESTAAAEEEPQDGVGTEDPEILAQKLQRSKEMTRRYSSALRRSQRRNRPEGLPPVHIPDWFLKGRVLRCGDINGSLRDVMMPNDVCFQLNHPEFDEHAVCSIPAFGDFETVREVSRFTRGLTSKRLSDEQKKELERMRVAKKLSKQGKANAKEFAGKLKEALQGIRLVTQEKLSAAQHEESSVTGEADVESKKKKEVVMEEKQKFELLPEGNSKDGKEIKVVDYFKRREAAKLRIKQSKRCVSPLVLAEIRATMAASLSALQPSIGGSFPAAKTNLILQSPSNEHEELIESTVISTAFELRANVVTLQAQELARLGGDYLGEGPESSPHSIRSLGYETYRSSSELGPTFVLETEAPEEENDFYSSLFPSHEVRLNLLKRMRKQLGWDLADDGPNMVNEPPPRPQTQSEMQLEDLKIASLLEALIDSPNEKQSRGLAEDAVVFPQKFPETLREKIRHSNFFDFSMDTEVAEVDLNSTLPLNAGSSLNLSVAVRPSGFASLVPEKSTIIYVKDFKELNATQYGGRVIQKLEEIVRKRRISGESIMIVGSTCSRDLTPELSANGVRALQSEGKTSFFRTIVVGADTSKDSAIDELGARAEGERGIKAVTPVELRKFRLINLRHIQDMLQSMYPEASAKISEMDCDRELERSVNSMFPESYNYRVLTYDEVHRIALTTIGIHVLNPHNDQISWYHIALAMGLLKASDVVKFMYFNKKAERAEPQDLTGLLKGVSKTLAENDNEKASSETASKRRPDLKHVAAIATKHEKRLMPGIANSDQIRTTFDQVHVPKETIDSIRTITSLSLLRPDAFNYGILATEKISGALLYGPPGTGKTLLAKAVAKESGSTVLEVSGTQILDKYVGEGEKNVTAIFSLARKLSPCIVFLDEADAIFASRDASRDRSSHRDILNQFLKEWDGLNDLSVFVMVATNRPFDLDDAVIRRLPRRLLVDLPTQDDRQEILKIHLRGEQLDESVDLGDLAKRTPFYSGSDLKNVAISAALACVKEENEQAVLEAAKAATESSETSDTASTSTPQATASEAQPVVKNTPQLVPGTKYNFPEKRILHARHFDKALQEISASISENMSSLTAIRKFDEQFGDRKTKKKRDFGFGMKVENNENAARVRT